MAIFFDSKKRALSNAQLKAIFAKANNKGIPKDEIIKKQTITNLNDEIRLEQAKGEKNYNIAVDKAITKVFKIPETPVTIPPKVKEVKTTKGPKRIIDLIRKVSVTNGISHAEARRILESSKVIPTGISDEAIVETKRRPSSPIQSPIQEIKEKPRKEEAKRKISDAILRRTLENQKNKQVELERKQKILIEMGELRDERTQLLQKDLNRVEEKSKSVPSGAVAAALAEPPLTTPGLITGVEPLKQTTEESVKQKIRKRALDLEVLAGLSPEVAMDQAKREVVSQITS